MTSQSCNRPKSIFLTKIQQHDAAPMSVSGSQMTKRMRRISHTLFLLFLFTVTWLVGVWILSKSPFCSAYIYDAIIVQGMTSEWYKTVFERLQPQTVLLDVGIGTAGALLKNSNIMESKQLTVLGIDVNQVYVEAARKAVTQSGLQDRVSIENLSIYNVSGIRRWIQQTQNIETVDAIYFSGSFSLLPDPLSALESARQLLRPVAGDRVYITQTYAASDDYSIMRHIKPLIRYITTIDFGQLVTEQKALSAFDEIAALKLVQHEKINPENAALRAFPSAYLSVLEAVDQLGDIQTCTAS